MIGPDGIAGSIGARRSIVGVDQRNAHLIVEEAPTPHHWHKTEGGGYLAHGEAHTAEGSLIFNEATLRRAIISVSGEWGAHIDVFDHMLRQIRKLGEIQAVLNK